MIEAIPQVLTLAQLCYRSRKIELEGWPPTTFILKEGQLERMKKWALNIPPEGYLTPIVWTGTPNTEERDGPKRTRENLGEKLADSIEIEEADRRVRTKRMEF